MRLLAALVLVALGCGDTSSPTDSRTTSTLLFKLDTTCVGGGYVKLMVADSLVGNVWMTPGDLSEPYPLTSEVQIGASTDLHVWTQDVAPTPGAASLFALECPAALHYTSAYATYTLSALTPGGFANSVPAPWKTYQISSGATIYRYALAGQIVVDSAKTFSAMVNYKDYTASGSVYDSGAVQESGTFTQDTAKFVFTTGDGVHRSGTLANNGLSLRFDASLPGMTFIFVR